MNLTSNEVLSDDHMVCNDEVSSLLEAQEECCGSQGMTVDYDRMLEQDIIEGMQAKAATVYYIDPDFLSTMQRGLIQWHMRLMLFDWMMEVSDEFALSRETFHLSITYVDLYLTRRRCQIEVLQLLGAASLLLACKVEEIVCPRVSHFTYATDNGFTHAQIVAMEGQIS